MRPQLDNLKSIRLSLDVSQSEMAKLLNISVRAVQSYEQGWRPLPAHVQCKAAMMLFLTWRKDQKRVVPCWELRGCSDDSKRECSAFRLNAGDFCWLLADACCRGQKLKNWEARVARCSKCDAMGRWLKGA